MSKKKKKIKKTKKPYFLAFVDIETGGFSVSKDGVVEVAIIIVERNTRRVVYKWHAKIKPYTMLSGNPARYGEKAFEKHGISLEDLEENGYDADKVAHSINNILKHYNVQMIVGHNVQFDIKRLDKFLETFGYQWIWFNFVDTIDLAKKDKPGLPSYSLENIIGHYGVSTVNAHRALADAFCTYELWIKIEKKN